VFYIEFVLYYIYIYIYIFTLVHTVMISTILLFFGSLLEIVNSKKNMVKEKTKVEINFFIQIQNCGEKEGKDT
jgi:hypothetical protein